MKNPIFYGTSRPDRVYHGGSWDGSAWNTRVSYRDWNYASYRDYNLGFRIFRTKEKL